MAGGSLDDAKKNKNDEFYTQLSDIENELKHYKEHFKDKVVFCNCDDPRESNFFKYFIKNFNHLELKALFSTCYFDSPVNNYKDLFGYYIKIEKIKDIKSYDDITDDFIDKLVDKNKIAFSNTDENYKAGDFRSAECVELLKQADIVVTNPPFSLFREYVAQLIEYDKKFLIIGNVNAISYKEIFPLIKANKMWLGYGFKGGNAYFKSFNLREFASGVYDENTGLVKFRNCAWFTNLDIKKRHEFLDLYKKYNSQEFLKFDNYDAINVDKTSEIPCNYYEPMGVPITFLDKYSPEQFEILDGIGRYSMLTGPTNETRGTYLTEVNGKPKYARIVIKRIKNEN